MILVDDRGGSNDLLKPLRAAGLPAEITRIEAGDLMFEGRGNGGHPVFIGIEYKKLSELVGSFRSGRLQGYQIPAMQKADFDFTFLLVEGEILTDKNGLLQKRLGPRNFVPLGGRMTVNELFKRTLTLHFQCGVMTWWTQNQRETIQAIDALYRTMTDRDLDQHMSHLTIYRPPPLTVVSKFRQTVSTFPEIGFKTSIAVEQKFKTIKRAINATSAEWQTIEGIGPKIAQKVQDWIN